MRALLYQWRYLALAIVVALGTIVTVLVLPREDRITEANYELITTGMSETEVEEVLGVPTWDSTKFYEPGSMWIHHACKPVEQRILVTAGYKQWSGDRYMITVWLDLERRVVDKLLSRYVESE